MKILLVNPLIPKAFRLLEYADDEAKKAIARRIMVGPPLALNELAGMCPDEEIVILDQKTEFDNCVGEYDYLERFIEEFKSMKPDMIGITCITAQYNAAIVILNKAKEMNPNVLTLVGGIHPTLCPESFIGSGVDLLSVGIGKYSFREIVRVYKEHGIKGNFSQIPEIAINEGDHFFYTKSLCSLSYEEVSKNYLFDDVLPNRALTDKYKYEIVQANKTIHYLSTSSGCTHKCNFCSIWQTTKGRYFHKSVDNIIRELKTMDNYKVIRFCDANTFGDLEKARLLFTRIIEEELDFHEYMADVRTDMVIAHPDIIQLAVRAGLRITICGLEASSDEELAAYNKSNTIANISNALKILNSLGVVVNGNYIIKPDYVQSDFERLADFVYRNPIFHSGFTILTPFPGTDLWNDMKDDIVIHNFDYYNLTNAVTKTKLPEVEFYGKVAEMYKISKSSTEQYFKMYHNPLLSK